MDAEQLVSRVTEDGVSWLRVQFVDYNGIARCRVIAADRLATVLLRGVNFSSSTIEFNTIDQFPPDATFTFASPDFWARPDPATYLRLPWQPDSARFWADLIDANGNIWPGDPRAALRRVEQHAWSLGLRFMVGFEAEAYVFAHNGEHVEPIGLPRFATVDGLEVAADFMRDLLATTNALGLAPPQWSEEYGPGQIEINLSHTSPLVATEQYLSYKEALRTLARRHGLLGTFMPKPFSDMAGSGLHIHLSVIPTDSDRNLLDDETDTEYGLSLLARQMIAGILSHGEALTALGATTVNSYKRFVPGSWAPTHITWAYASRGAFVRVPERQTPRRLEVRIADGAGNPYIYLAALLAAAIDGVERHLAAPPEVPGDVTRLTRQEQEARGVRPVPPSLDRALDALACDDHLRTVLGPIIFEEFIKIKRSEWDAFRLHVDEWDRSWYLEHV
jgi:glutamine synthetase